jgi:hypothetical protein
VILLCHWEVEELLEYFSDHDWLWQSNDEKTFHLRLLEDGTAGCAVQLIPPSKPGPIRLFRAVCHPQSWTNEESDVYFNQILVERTNYGLRVAQAAFLQEELKLDAKTATAVSIGLGRIANDPATTPDVPGVQGNLLGERAYQLAQALPVSRRVEYLAKGGWVSLEFKHDKQLHLAISLPAPNGGGYTHPLKGVVRHPFRDSYYAALNVFGWGEDLDLRADAQRRLIDDNPGNGETPTDGGDIGSGLSDAAGTAGAGADRSGEEAIRLPDEPKSLTELQRLPETLLLEERREP